MSDGGFSRLNALVGRVTGGDPRGALFREVATGFAGTAAMRVVSLALSLAASALLARALAPTQFGVYSLALATAGVLSIPTELGLARLVVRDVARYRVKEQWGLLRGLMLRANQIVFVSTVVVSVGLAVWLLSAEAGSRGDPLVFVVAFLLIPLAALGRLRGAVLSGLGSVAQGQIPDGLVRPAILLLLLIGALLVGGLFALSAMILNVVAAALAFVLGIWMLLRRLPPQVRQAAPEYETRAWIRSLVPLSLIGGLDAISMQTDLVVLGLYRGVAEAGVYRPAALLALQVPVVLSLLSIVLAPQFSRLFHSGDRDRLDKLARRSAAFVTVASFPLAAICVFFGGPLLHLFFGAEYVGGATALAILAVGQLFNVGVGSAGLILNMTGHERDVMRAGLIATVLNLVLNLVLVPRFGMNGAAWATASSVALVNLLLLWAVERRLGIVMLPLPSRWRARGG